MKKIILFIQVFIIVALSSCAPKLKNSMLWKISGNELKQPSYLFGTIHITCDATFSKSVQEAIDKTTQTVLEVDMDDPSFQSKMMKGMNMKDGKTIQEYVSKEEYIAIDSLFIKNLGMSVKSMGSLKPTLLIGILYPKILGCTPQYFEAELVKVTKQQGEEIKGLEAIEDQLKIFDEIPYKEQVKELTRSAKDNLVYEKENMAKMQKLYKESDITGMLKMMNDESNGSILSNYMEKLLDDRNKKWISKIESYAKEKPTFFGVGAGHLAGKNGVILLLRKAGYTVTAIME